MLVSEFNIGLRFAQQTSIIELLVEHLDVQTSREKFSVVKTLQPTEWYTYIRSGNLALPYLLVGK